MSCRRCGRGYVQHDLVTSRQPLREVTAETLRILDLPPQLRIVAGPAQQLSIAGQDGIDAQ
jgi:hypothetical protein